MATDNIELVNRDYTVKKNESKTRQIKTRPMSFSSIFSKFKDFLSTEMELQKAQDKLDATREKIMSTGYKGTEDDKKLDRDLKKYAKLEEKIMVLSDKEVPDKFVESRAIKLKKNMMENLRWNSTSRLYGHLYTADHNKENEIFGSEVVEDIPQVDVSDSKEQMVKNIIEEQSHETAKSVSSILEDESKKSNRFIEKEEFVPKFVPVDEEEFVPKVEEKKNNDDTPIRDEIQVVPDEMTRRILTDEVEKAFNSTELEETDDSVLEVQEDTQDSQEIEIGEIKEILKRALDDLEVKNSVTSKGAEDIVNSVDTITPEEVQASINKKLDDLELDDKHISTNNSRKAKVERFDNNGQERYIYRPMTDEEILAAREKLGIKIINDLPILKKDNAEALKGVFTPVKTVDYRELFRKANEKAIRDEVVISPDRANDTVREFETVEDEEFSFVPKKEEKIEEDIPEFEYVEDTKSNDDDLAFDLSDATASDINRFIPHAESISEFNAIKNRVLELQKQKEAADMKKVETEKRAEEARKKAQSSKQRLAVSNNELAHKIKLFKDYEDALMYDIEFTNKKTKEVEMAIQTEDRFVEQQEAKTKQNISYMDEIDSLIGPMTTNVVPFEEHSKGRVA